MKKKVRSNVSILLALVIVMSQLISVAAADADYVGHWAESEISAWVEAGIISGYPDGSFKPNKAVTRAEFVTLLDNLFGFQEVAKNTYTDVDSKAWYAQAVLKASAAGVVQGSDNLFRPMSEITRQEAAIALYNAFAMEAADSQVYTSFADSQTVAAWAAEQVNALVAGDYMSGRGDNELAPRASITRAETVKLIDNIAGMLASQSLEGTMVNGNLFIAEADTVVSDSVITGDVYIAQSVGEGDVTFDGVTIEGTLVVFGGGENTIELKDTVAGELIAQKRNGNLRVLASGSSRIAKVIASCPVKIEESPDITGAGFQDVVVDSKDFGVDLDPGFVDVNVPVRTEVRLLGDFDGLSLASAGATVKVESGSINIFTVLESARKSIIEILEDAIVKEMEVKASASVSGTGTVEKATVEADGATFEQEPEDLEVKEDVTVVVDGEEKTGEETTPPPSTNTGGTGTTVTNVNLTFDLSSASNTHVLTITAPSNADYKVIADKVLTAVNNEFDVIYDKYNTNLENNEGMLLIDSITWFEYAGQDMLAGTIFENQIRHLPATAGPNPDYTDLQKKDIAHDVLTVIENNINNIDTVEADVVSIANQVTFADVEYNGSTFTKATLSKNGNVVAEFVQGGDKAAFIGVFFDEVKAMTMGTNVEYTLTFELAIGGTRTSVLSAQ